MFIVYNLTDVREYDGAMPATRRHESPEWLLER
jgi:hypothetical protein